MFYKVMGVLALAVIGGSAFSQTARVKPTNFQINEILINPAGGGDNNQGREFIEIYGPANASLDGYAIIVLENEEDGATNSDRGRVKNKFIIPNGKSTDANGLFIIRDLTAAGGVATAFTPTDTLGASNRWDVDFNTIVSTVPVRGNTLENEGGNYFLVTGVNTNLVQKQEDGSGNKQVDGTDLDTDDNCILDYYEDADGDRIINGEEASPTGVKLADAIVDFVFVGEADYETETDEGHSVSNKPEKNNNYILAFLPGGCSPFADFEKGYVICDIQLGADDGSSWTPDLIARVGDWDAVVADVAANGSAQDFDATERSFSHKYLNPFANIVGTLRATPGRVGQYSVDDKNGRTWTH